MPYVPARSKRPAGAVKRRFELFALEAWEDSNGRVLQVDHGTVVVAHLEPDDRPLNHQRTFDEFIEEELFWDHHLSTADNNYEDRGVDDAEGT